MYFEEVYANAPRLKLQNLKAVNVAKNWRVQVFFSVPAVRPLGKKLNVVRDPYQHTVLVFSL